MTFEDLIALKEAQKVIERLASTLDTSIEELGVFYSEAHKNLGGIIDRWECKP